MTSKNIFSRLFSFLAMAALLVSCSQNDGNAMTTTKTDAQANRSSQVNFPHGKLIIHNNTHHTFVDDLYVLNILRILNDGRTFWLSQKIVINPYTTIELAKYSNTTTLGIDYDNNARWNISENGVSSAVSEQDADILHRSTRLYNDDVVGEYVEWNSFNGTSDDGTVKFKFKVDALAGEIFVNEPYGTFTTTALIDDLGDIIIRLEE